MSRRQLSNKSEGGPAVEKGLGQGTTHPPLPPNYQMSVGLLQENALEKSCNLLRQTVNYLQESARPSMCLPLARLAPNAEPSLQANPYTHTHSWDSLPNLHVFLSDNEVSAQPKLKDHKRGTCWPVFPSIFSVSMCRSLLSSACYSEDSMRFCVSL